MAIIKALVILVALVAYAHGRVTYRRRPNFDCEGICRPHGMKPVCSDENPGRTYDNECFLDCNWKYKQCDGRCPCRQNNFNARQSSQQNNWNRQQFRSQPQIQNIMPQSPSRPYRPPSTPQYRPNPPRRGNICICDGAVDPVCTTDGTERNECLAQCHNKHVLYDGECWLRRP